MQHLSLRSMLSIMTYGINALGTLQRMCYGVPRNSKISLVILYSLSTLRSAEDVLKENCIRKASQSLPLGRLSLSVLCIQISNRVLLEVQVPCLLHRRCLVSCLG